MKRLFISILSLIVFIHGAFAQNDIVRESECEPFVSVNVSDDFVLKLIPADTCKVKTVVDERLDKYVQTSVQNGILFIVIDRKSIPSDLKKSLRVKGVPLPVLEAEVYMPSIKSLEMSENAVLSKSDVFYSDAFALSVTDKARVEKFYVDCNTAEINLSKTAFADLEVKAAEELFVITSNASKAVVKQTGKGLKVDAAGSSVVSAVVEVENLNVLTSGTAIASFVSGTARNMKASASGASRIEAEEVSASMASMSQAGTTKCYVNVTDTLKVNLTGNSLLTFKNKPYIDVERIVGSTLIKSDDPKRR